MSSDIHMRIYIYMYIYMHMYAYLGIYVGSYWKFHSNNVICIELLACNKAGMDRNEYNLHRILSPCTLWFFTCITDIWAHKPWLLASFAMHNFPMYHIANVAKNVLYVCLLCCIYMYCVAIKLIHCHCHWQIQFLKQHNGTLKLIIY